MTTVIRQEINIINQEVAYATNDIETINLDTNDYDDGTYYFEIVAKNTHADPQPARLFNSNSASEVSVNVPGNSNEWTRVRSSSFTPNDTYPEKTVNMLGATVTLKSAKVIILQSATDITDTQTQIEIGAYQSKVEAADPNIWYPLDEPKYWKYEDSKWDPTPIFTFGLTYLVENNMGPQDFGIQEDDGAGGWTTTPIATITGLTSEDVDYQESSSFTPTDGKIHRLVWRTANDMYANDVYNAKIIVMQIGGEPRSIIGTSGNAIYGASGTSEAYGQSFDSGNGGQLNYVVVRGQKIGSPTDNIYAIITSTAATDTPITNGQTDDLPAASVSSVTGGNWIKLEFSTPPTLTADTTYYVKIYRDGSRDTSNYITIRSDNSGNPYPDGQKYRRASGSWAAQSDMDLLFIMGISGNNFITKLQPEYLLINEAQSDTGLQEFMTAWDPDEWDGVDNTYFHEHSADSAGSNTKLQTDLDTTPVDIINSDITGDDLTRGGTALTMPATAKEIDAYIVTA